MAKHQTGRLSALAVSRIKEPGLYPDGLGLYLRVTPAGGRSWIFRYRHSGRKTPRDMGLGPLDTLGLAKAREKAAEGRLMLLAGEDPIEARRALRASKAAERAKAISFREAAERYIGTHAASWRNGKHAEQWRSTLNTYAHPLIGSVSVSQVDTGMVVKVLEPIWTAKNETAHRVRGRIEAILDWAAARGLRTGDNPARWRGQLEKLFPSRSKVAGVKHHPALPFTEIGNFLEALRSQEGVAARALEFLILTAARTSEVIGAQWEEIDLDKATWTIPADRIKAGKEHRVPLNKAALDVLCVTKPDARQGLIFSGGKEGKPLSPNAILALLKRMKRTDITAHGFRSTFRDWAAERTNYPREVAEMALAHAISDKVEAAYRRGDLFLKRKRLMEEWARHCNARAIKATGIAHLHAR